MGAVFAFKVAVQECLRDVRRCSVPLGTRSTPLAQEQHGDDAQRDEQAYGGPVVEQLRRAGEARRGAGGGDRLAGLGRGSDARCLTGCGSDRGIAGGLARAAACKRLGIMPLFWSS